jgi:hypothetical protein
MGYIRSSTVDNFTALDGPSSNVRYPHPAERRSGAIPMAFQVTSPFDDRLALLPHALVLHVNPQSLSEQHTKKVERIQTRGGWVEQHWGDDLTEISCSGGTGAFVNLYTGLSSVMRQKTIAWDRYRDLYELYRSNGSIYDPFGAIVLQGKIQLLFDRGAYIGTFRSFDVEETEDSPFAFNISWSFKVEVVLARVPGAFPRSASPGLTRDYVETTGAGFQAANSANSLTITNWPPDPEPTPATEADKAAATSGTAQAAPESPPAPVRDQGKPVYLVTQQTTPEGYRRTKSGDVLPSGLNSQVKGFLNEDYKYQSAPFQGSDGKTYVAIVESHLDDHVPDKNGDRYVRWHKGISVFVKK